MGIVKEDINFERGKDPKRAMDLGMSAEKKLDVLVEKINEFIPTYDSPFKWIKSTMASYDYEIYQYADRKVRVIYGTYSEDDKLFSIGDTYGISSIEEVITHVLMEHYPHLEEDLIILNKVKTYLESKSI